MSKTILFLRPHPFVADSLAQTFGKLGFSSIKFTDAHDFERHAAELRHAAGAVVSLALTSTVAQSAEEMIGELYRRSPTMPLVLTGLADINSLTKTARIFLPRAQFHTIDSSPSALREPGRDVLIVRRDDLIQPDRASRLAALILRHCAGDTAHRLAA
jgi:hypothetical protein